MGISEDTNRVRLTSIGWMMQRLSRRVEEDMAARLRPLGLTVPGFAVMMTVLEDGPLTQAQIGRRFRMPAYTISRALDLLEERGLVERRPHERSRRAHAVHATPEGLALAPRLFALVDEVNAELVAPLSQDDRARLGAILARLMPEDDRP